MFSRIALAIALLASAPFAMAASGDYKAGDADIVKKLPGRDFESVKNTNMPMLVYFHDTEVRRNDYAKFLETKVLASAELKDKLKPFLFLKIKTDGTDYKGWPPDFLARAKNGAALMLASSDMAQVVFYDKNMPKEAITPQTLMAQMQQVLSYEEKKKGQGGPAAKDDKEKDKGPMPPVAENKPLPGLNTDKDKDKKDAKPPEKKKVAAPTDE